MNHSLQQDFDNPADAKRHAILSVALSVFTTYGFSKVTMDDIAKAAGISRPALYQFFKNKHEIFRGGLEAWCQTSLDVMQVELAKDASQKERIFQMVKLGIFDQMTVLDQTPHGNELLELKNSLSKDVLNDFLTQVAANIETLFNEAFDQSTSRKQAFDASMLTANFLYWMEGMKVQVDDPKRRDQLLQSYLDVQFAAIA